MRWIEKKAKQGAADVMMLGLETAARDLHASRSSKNIQKIVFLSFRKNIASYATHSFVCLFSLFLKMDPVKRNDGPCRRLREGDVRNPIGGVRHSMVDARLAVLGARITGRDDAHQFPASALLQHQRTTRISLLNHLKLNEIKLNQIDLQAALVELIIYTWQESLPPLRYPAHIISS